MFALLVAQNIAFYVIAALMVFAAIRVVTCKNVVHAALWLVLVLAGVAAQYIVLAAEFVAITQVLVNNGDTTVIGGIYISREQSNQDRTPGLYRLPLLGWLFKRDSITDESRELLIFITPKIIRL